MTIEHRDTQAAALQAAQTLLAAVGLTTDDLQQHSSQRVGPTLLEYIEAQLPSLRQHSPGTGGTYTAGLRLLADGDHTVCECDCPACDDPDGCPCHCGCEVDESGTHHGLPPDRATRHPHHDTCSGNGNVCASRWTGRGSVALSAVPINDLEDCQHWVRVRAFRVARHRDRNRVQRGRTPSGRDGRGASENYVGAVGWLYDRAIADGLATRNPGKQLHKPKRLQHGPRSLSADQAEEVFHIAVTTGHDPDGDGLLVVFIAETAARRGGILNSRCGFLNGRDCTLKIKERKGDGAEHIVPVTPSLAAALQRHMTERGPRRAAPADAPEAVRRAGIPCVTALDPMLYRPPIDEFDDDGYFVRRTTRPVTKKSLENLRERVKRHLPWADDFFLRWHDFRHTTGTMLDRVAGHAVAARHLGHQVPSDTTGIYTGADLTEDAAAIQALFGVRHPLAGHPDDVTAIDLRQW